MNTKTIREYAKAITAIIMLVYNVARIAGIEMPISEENILNMVSPTSVDIFINLLLTFGIYQVRNGPKVVEEKPDVETLKTEI